MPSSDHVRPSRPGRTKPASRDIPFPIEPALWPRVTRSIGFAPQQQRVVEMILRGQRDKEIAAELGLSVPTVRTYISRAFARVGAADRVELILLVLAKTREIRESISHPS